MAEHGKTSQAHCPFLHGTPVQVVAQSGQPSQLLRHQPSNNNNPPSEFTASGSNSQRSPRPLSDSIDDSHIQRQATKEDVIVPSPGRRIVCCTKSDVAKRIFSHIASSSSRSSPRHSLEMSPMTLERARAGPVGGGITGIPSHAQSLLQVPPTGRPRSRSTGSVAESIGEKPLASTSGGAVSMTIILQEPALFLRGSECPDYTERSSTMLRGKLLVKINKATKVKTITLAFRGRIRTEWPEGTFALFHW